MFIGRKDELKMLEEHYNSGKAELMILYGRRRIGKTELINQFIADKISISYTAVESVSQLQLESFSNVLSNFENKSIKDNFTDWESCFNKLNELSQTQRLVVVIDEFPYLVKKDESIPSILQKVWDHKLKNSKIMLILSGSSMSFIEKELLGGKKPLYGRATSIYKLLPLSYKESAEFVPNYSVEDKIITYAITTGVPYYLSLFNDKLTIKDNIDKLILKRDGQLHNEVENLLREEFREISAYNSIITAIAVGNGNYKSVLQYSKLSDKSLSTYLRKLKDVGIIEKETPQNCPISQQQNKRGGIYIICDGIYKFYYQYYLPNASIFESKLRLEAYDNLIAPTLHQFPSKAFENICINYLYDNNYSSTVPYFYNSFKRWWGSVTKVDINNKNKTTLEEIDIVGKPINKQDPTLLGECKFTSLPFDTHQYYKLIHKLEIKENVVYYLFSLNGFTNQLIEDSKENKNINLISGVDLYKWYNHIYIKFPKYFFLVHNALI